MGPSVTQRATLIGRLVFFLGFWRMVVDGKAAVQQAKGIPCQALARGPAAPPNVLQSLQPCAARRFPCGGELCARGHYTAGVCTEKEADLPDLHCAQPCIWVAWPNSGYKHLAHRTCFDRVAGRAGALTVALMAGPAGRTQHCVRHVAAMASSSPSGHSRTLMCWGV